eukprot:TRINITY_DN25492_c0_g1_i3.p1 TRINITY_DN25492_c0_g1~~TRINITY_DN25492_c0_g1_i3.p1  ORF type:complete len:549 (+),score=58.71 TRINITY_DN25492_c0_g1_i3:195-1841(+)
MNYVLLVVFTLDLITRGYAYGRHFWLEPFNIFECALILQDMVLQFVPGLPAGVAVLRIFRFARLVRILRQLNELRELYMMMMGIVSSIRPLIFGSLLLFTTITGFGVLCVYFVRPVQKSLPEEVYRECPWCQGAFETVFTSNLTLIATLVAGDSWAGLALPIIYEDATAGFILISSLVVIHLGMLNTIVAVIVDRQAQARIKDQEYLDVVESEEIEESMNSLHIMFSNIDLGENSETVTLEALLEVYDTSSTFQEFVNRMDLYRSDIPILFCMLDVDCTGDVSVAEFVHGLHDVRTKDSHTLAVMTKYYCELLVNKWNEWVAEKNMQPVPSDSGNEEDRPRKTLIIGGGPSRRPSWNGGSCDPRTCKHDSEDTRTDDDEQLHACEFKPGLWLPLVEKTSSHSRTVNLLDAPAAAADSWCSQENGTCDSKSCCRVDAASVFSGSDVLDVTGLEWVQLQVQPDHYVKDKPFHPKRCADPTVCVPDRMQNGGLHIVRPRSDEVDEAWKPCQKGEMAARGSDTAGGILMSSRGFSRCLRVPSGESGSSGEPG